MDAVNLGEHIKQEREKRRMTLRQLADIAGVSASMLNRIENGHIKQPSQVTLEGISRGLMIPYERLDRIQRGLPAESEKTEGPSQEVLDLARELMELPEDKRDAIRKLLGL